MSKKTPPYLPLFLDDWFGSATVAGLTLEQEAVYLRLLGRQMQLGRLPEDFDRMAAIVGAPRAALDATWAVVGDGFERDVDGWFHPKTEALRVEHTRRAEARAESARKAGLASAAARQVNAASTSRSTSRQPSHSHSHTQNQNTDPEPQNARGRARPPRSFVEDAVRDLGPGIREGWLEFEQHRREIRKPLTPTATKRALKALKDSRVNAIAVLDMTVRNGWTGIETAVEKLSKRQPQKDQRREKLREWARAQDAAQDPLSEAREAEIIQPPRITP